MDLRHTFKGAQCSEVEVEMRRRTERGTYGSVDFPLLRSVLHELNDLVRHGSVKFVVL